MDYNSIGEVMRSSSGYLWIIGFFSVAALACQNSVEPDEAALEITASTTQTNTFVGELIVLDVAIRNTSDRRIEIPGSPVVIDVRDATGAQVAFGQFNVPLVKLPNQWIAPGETIAGHSFWTGEATVPGEKMFPGPYTIRAAVAVLGNGHQRLIYSDPVELDLKAH